MPKVLENVIVGAMPNPESLSVALRWANGATTVASFRHLAGKGVFAAFNDPAFFARAAIGERGRSLEWPGELDVCADALWFESHPEEAPREQRRPVEQAT
jgi:hypothetical protein